MKSTSAKHGGIDYDLDLSESPDLKPHHQIRRIQPVNIADLKHECEFVIDNHADKTRPTQPRENFPIHQKPRYLTPHESNSQTLSASSVTEWRISLRFKRKQFNYRHQCKY